MSVEAGIVRDVIAELYPQAWAHLETARRAKSDLGLAWHDLLEADLVDNAVMTHADGSGHIVAYANWPFGCREQLTDLFKTCVDSLWACLDSLVIESIEIFSALKRTRNPDRPRYFPVADSQENFAALLAESCLDGVLYTQFAMVRDCQPFEQVPEDEGIDRFRIGLRYLIDWTSRLEEGSRVGAWITPVEPQVHVEGPARLAHMEAEAPGELDDERIVARFKLTEYDSEASIQGQAGSYVDLAFPDGFTPHDHEDTFDRRFKSVIDVVSRFAVSFAWLAGKAPGIKSVVPGSGADHDATWVEVNRSGRYWSAEELAALAESDTGLGVVVESAQLTLIVATPDGVYERVIPNATPLRQHLPRGTAAERAAQEAAATWGLPDFVMRPYVERKGAGVREVSDGLIVVGDRGVVVQAKCRDAEVGDPAKEARWLDKQIAKATSQINGTARRLSTKTTNMTNGRGRDVTIDGTTISWVGAVIIEHPDPPTDYVIPELESRTPWVVLLRRDWEFLFNQLRSSRAVVDYLHRVEHPSEILGTEPQRYYELARLDAAAPPRPVDPALLERGEPRSVPLLPTAPAGSDDNEAHGMVRIMCEDVATSPIGESQEEDRLRILASIDGLPVAHRTELGRLLLDGLQAARQAQPGTTTWRFRTFRASQGSDQLGFGVCSTFSEVTQAAFRSWLLLRHHERGDIESLSDATTIGVLLTPRHDGRREWDTTMNAVKGDPELTDEELRQSRALWNTQH